MTRLVEDGSERSSPGSLSRMSGTVAPGKQCVVALKNLMSLIMESPTINVVGEKRGRGGDSRGLVRLEGTGSVSAPCVEVADRGWGVQTGERCGKTATSDLKEDLSGYCLFQHLYLATGRGGRSPR